MWIQPTFWQSSIVMTLTCLSNSDTISYCIVSYRHMLKKGCPMYLLFCFTRHLTDDIVNDNNSFTIIKVWLKKKLAFDFGRFCVVNGVFHPRHNGQWPPTSKNFLSQIVSITFFSILILQKEPVHHHRNLIETMNKYQILSDI